MVNAIDRKAVIGDEILIRAAAHGKPGGCFVATDAWKQLQCAEDVRVPRLGSVSTCSGDRLILPASIDVLSIGIGAVTTTSSDRVGTPSRETSVDCAVAGAGSLPFVAAADGCDVRLGRTLDDDGLDYWPGQSCGPLWDRDTNLASSISILSTARVTRAGKRVRGRSVPSSHRARPALPAERSRTGNVHSRR